MNNHYKKIIAYHAIAVTMAAIKTTNRTRPVAAPTIIPMRVLSTGETIVGGVIDSKSGRYPASL